MIRDSSYPFAKVVSHPKLTLSIQARYSNDGGSNSGSAFIGGFVLGGVLIIKALAGTDKKELLKKLPNFIYDEEKTLEISGEMAGSEMGGSGSTKRLFKTRQKLAQKIAELNSAIGIISDDDELANGVVPDETEALA
ncbi:inner membrane localized protein [Tanacetum coccineum]